jgi:hypothetical protein
MAPASCGSPGTVYLNGTPFIQNGKQFVGAGSTVTVQANPNPGFVFAGWLAPIGVLSNSQALVLSLPVNGPITIFPIFQRARQVSMSIATSPAGLQVLLRPHTLFFTGHPRVGREHDPSGGRHLAAIRPAGKALDI